MKKTAILPAGLAVDPVKVVVADARAPGPRRMSRDYLAAVVELIVAGQFSEVLTQCRRERGRRRRKAARGPGNRPSGRSGRKSEATKGP